MCFQLIKMRRIDLNIPSYFFSSLCAFFFFSIIDACFLFPFGIVLPGFGVGCGFGVGWGFGGLFLLLFSSY